MPRHRVGLLSITLLALLAVPSQGSANIIDLIWEMSGPTSVGYVPYCKIALTGEVTECALGWLVKRSTREPRTWLSIEGGIYVSTGKNADRTDYRAGGTWILAFEPLLEARSGSRKGFTFHHGMGLAYNFLFGGDFRRFNNAGLKLRPVGVIFHTRRLRWDVAYNLRLYPDGFTPDEFGFGLRMDGDRTFERVHGFSVGLLFD